MVDREKPPYKMFRSVTPAWDNTPRKGEKGTVFINSDIDYYEEWLQKTIDFTEQNNAENEKIVFINCME